MTILATASPDGRELTIKVKGRFDFSVHQDFCHAYEHDHRPVVTYVVDLREVSYLDSSALGMLLLLRDHAGGDTADVQIANCNADVRKILAISNFDQLFVMR